VNAGPDQLRQGKLISQRSEEHTKIIKTCQMYDRKRTWKGFEELPRYLVKKRASHATDQILFLKVRQGKDAVHLERVS
jgi:hypothetical protein